MTPGETLRYAVANSIFLLSTLDKIFKFTCLEKIGKVHRNGNLSMKLTLSVPSKTHNCRNAQ